MEVRVLKEEQATQAANLTKAIRMKIRQPKANQAARRSQKETDQADPLTTPAASEGTTKALKPTRQIRTVRSEMVANRMTR